MHVYLEFEAFFTVLHSRDSKAKHSKPNGSPQLIKTAPDARLAYQERPLGVQVNLSHCALCMITLGSVHSLVPKGANRGLNGDLVQQMGTARYRCFGALSDRELDANL
jgi:hypothetical protein